MAATTTSKAQHQRGARTEWRVRMLEQGDGVLRASFIGNCIEQFPMGHTGLEAAPGSSSQHSSSIAISTAGDRLLSSYLRAVLRKMKKHGSLSLKGYQSPKRTQFMQPFFIVSYLLSLLLCFALPVSATIATAGSQIFSPTVIGNITSCRSCTTNSYTVVEQVPSTEDPAVARVRQTNRGRAELSTLGLLRIG